MDFTGIWISLLKFEGAEEVAGKMDGRFYLLVQTARTMLTLAPAESLHHDTQSYEAVMQNRFTNCFPVLRSRVK